jgi:hypothetical protein
MRRSLAFAAFLLGILLSVPASAQLQYFGYVGGADDDFGLNATQGFTNFAHFGASQDLADPFVRTRVAAIAQKGLKASIDLGSVFWCDYDQDSTFHYRCVDWLSRWQQWKTFNASILTHEKVLAFSVLDEPFNRAVDMTSYEEVVQKVKADFPLIKIYMHEAACVVLNQQCGLERYQGSGAFASYHGSLPGVDWVTAGIGGVLPSTDQTFLDGRSLMKSRFPDKKWLYVMDGYWNPSAPPPQIPRVEDMALVARDWYDVARNDPDAVLLGVIFWNQAISGVVVSQDFPCSVLREHVAIGRAITGKVRAATALPIGRVEGISSSGVFGWACDPDGTLCEQPRIDLYNGGTLLSQFPVLYSSPWSVYDVANSQCSSGISYLFLSVGQFAGTSGYPITAVARDLDSGSVTLPSKCAQNPACVWYSKLYAPKGYMQEISASGTAAGWVCDPDAPGAASKVRLTSNGTLIGTYTTNLASEQAVANECRGGYLHRFAVQLPTWTKGQTIRAYAQDFTSNEVQIPWLCPQGWWCTW